MECVIDTEAELKEIERQLKKGPVKSGSSKLTEEDKAKLKEVAHEKVMLTGKDGEIHHFEEIDYIINNIIKHQAAAFKYPRDMEPLKENCELSEGETNTVLEDKEFEKSETTSLVFTNDEIIKDQRGVAFYLVKKIGINLLTGKSIMNISLPIKLFEPKSLLEKIAESFCFAPYYFLKAADQDDPIERVKTLITLYIASLQLEPQMLKPFNPILGETFQGVIGEYEVALEQISHHPPITAVQMWWPTNKKAPTFDCHIEFEVRTGMSEVSISKMGEAKVIFPDTKQTILSHSYPQAVMHGVIKGTRTYDFVDSLKLSDEGNNIHADIVFNPDKKGWLKRMFSSSQKTKPDYFEGLISNKKDIDYKGNRGSDIDKLKKKWGLEIYGKIEGSWIDNMKIDDEIVWEYSKYKPLQMRFINNPLPSDCRFRTDLIALLNEDLTKAQEQKDVLENIQREDRKLRKNALKK